MSRTHVRRRRAVLVATVTLAVAPVAGRALGTDDPPREFRTLTHVVRAGDTLWSIARAASGPEGDPRPFVDALRDLNPVEPGSLAPGTELLIPRSSGSSPRSGPRGPG